MLAEKTLSTRARRQLRARTIAALTALAAGMPALADIGAVGDVYVSESYYGDVLQYDGVTGALVGTFAVSPGASTPLGQEWGPDGNLYVCTLFSLQHWRLLRYDGTTGANLGPVIIEQSDSQLTVGKCIAFGPDGDLYIGNWAQHRVTRYDGQTFAVKATFQDPQIIGTPNDMKFAPNGNLFVLSGGGAHIVEFSTEEASVTGATGLDLIGVFAGPTPGGSLQPQSFAFGPNGDIFIAHTSVENGGIARFDGTTGEFLGWFLTGAQCPKPSGLLFDNHGRLLVSNYQTWDVLAFDAETGAYQGVFIPMGSGGLGSPFHMTNKPGAAPNIPGDLDGNGVVDVFDLLILLGAWGPCSGKGECLADLNGDGVVDVFDLLTLLGNWG
jgi:streptogramin lyase